LIGRVAPSLGAAGFTGARDCAIRENAAEPSTAPAITTFTSRGHIPLLVIVYTPLSTRLVNTATEEH
jgi:hypothetical protein